jgi:hypothetical protein
MKTSALFLVSSAVLWAQLGFQSPKIGFVQDGGNVLRAVSGIAGSFVVGSPIATGIVSAAFSGSYGAAKTDTTLTTFDAVGNTIGTKDTPAGPALFAFSRSGTPAFVYFTGSNGIWKWDGQEFQPTDIDLSLIGSGQVLSIGSNDVGELILFVQRTDAVYSYCFFDDGRLFYMRFYLNASGPLLVLANGTMIYRDPAGLALEGTDKRKIPIPVSLPEHFTLQQMGEDWIAIRDLETGNQLGLRIKGQTAELYSLPGASQ